MGTWITRFAALAIAGIAMASTAAAQTISQSKLKAFAENSIGKYGDADAFNLEDVLFRVVESGATSANVADRFAKKIGARREKAAAYVALLLDVSAERTACEAAEERKPTCGLHPGAPLYSRAEKLTLEEPTGGLLFAMLANVNLYWSYDEAQDTREIAKLASRHPASDRLLSQFFAYGHDPAYLIPLLTKGGLGDKEAIALANRADALPTSALIPLLTVDTTSEVVARILAANAGAASDDAANWDGWGDALLESAERRAMDSSLTVRAGLAQAALIRKLDIGLDTEALSAWDAYPAQLRKMLPLAPASCSLGPWCHDASNAAYALIDRLAAALWAAGRREDALEIMSRASGIPGYGPYADKTHAALSEAMTPKLNDNELFAAFIEDKAPGWTRPEPKEHVWSAFAAPGWLFSAKETSPTVRSLIAARLRQAGHADMADCLMAQRKRSFDDNAPRPKDTFASILPTSLSDRSAAWLAAIAAANHTIEAQRPSRPAIVSTRPLDPWWVERKLPSSVKAWEEADESDAPPKSLKLPVASYSVIRYTKLGTEHAIVYMSADYDLPGEIPAFGLWFAQTEHEVWQRPIYLGLQQHFPYVATPASRLPLISATGKLTLEVRAEEIDAASISFPPVGLSLKRNEGALYLEFDLSELRADRDNDYLADIEERKLGLDYANPDMDGDSVLDGIDPMPLTRPEPSMPPLQQRVAQAIIKKIMGHDVGAITINPSKPGDDPLQNALGGGPAASRTRMTTTFLVGDAKLFAGLSPDFRLMVYSDADVKTLNQGAAPFMPPEILTTFASLDGATRLVVWSARWRGGAFFVRCTAGDGPCEVENISEWIT